MKLFEKYLSDELSVLRSALFEFKLKINSSLSRRFEQYNTIRNDLKYMFLINEAEKEISRDKSLLAFNVLTDRYSPKADRDEDILNYIDFALKSK